jgi:membrane protease YdiL (CAAX protease family)
MSDSSAPASDWRHLSLVLLTLWLVLTSPWIAMYRRVPADADWLDYAHIALGLVTLVLTLVYVRACSRGGRWRLYFPFGRSRLAEVGRDLGGLLRGRIPAAEGGGLFGLIEGLLLLALLATAMTGAAWFVTQGSAEALSWRGYHAVAVRGLVALFVLHALSVSLHLLDFLRD